MPPRALLILTVLSAVVLRVTLSPADARELALDPSAVARASTAMRGALPGELELFDDPSTAAAELRWQPDRECVRVYRVETHESFRDEAVARFFNRVEEHSVAFVSLDWRPDDRIQDDPDGRFVTGRLRYDSDDAGTRALSSEPTPLSIDRDVRLSAHFPGPSAPSAACRDRSWDSAEDVLAFGWPRLPARPTPVGDQWNGTRVEGDGTSCSSRNGCCNLAACLDDEGRRDRSRPCTTGPWRESLIGLHRLGDEPMAVVRSSWDDGRGSLQSARAERFTLVSRAHGRPVVSRTTVELPASGIERVVQISAVDDCGGGLGALGWTAPAAMAERIAQARAAVETRKP